MQETLIGLRTNDSAGSPVTVDDAVGISDNAMEHTLRCLLAAVQAPEVLDSSKGDSDMQSCLHRQYSPGLCSSECGNSKQHNIVHAGCEHHPEHRDGSLAGTC